MISDSTSCASKEHLFDIRSMLVFLSGCRQESMSRRQAFGKSRTHVSR
jgi:hypothetical protein